MNDSVNTKSKSYRVLVRLSSDVTDEKIALVNNMKNIAVSQRNPTRVPRRADLIRDKMVEELTCVKVSEDIKDTFFKSGVPEIAGPEIGEEGSTLLVVDMKTSAGTYVKEFVHGDNGNTSPNLHELLDVEKANVLALDVTKIHLEWPKSE